MVLIGVQHLKTFKMRKILLIILIIFTLIVLGLSRFEEPDYAYFSVFGYEVGANWSDMIYCKILMIGGWLFYALTIPNKD